MRLGRQWNDARGRAAGRLGRTRRLGSTLARRRAARPRGGAARRRCSRRASSRTRRSLPRRARRQRAGRGDAPSGCSSGSTRERIARHARARRRREERRPRAAAARRGRRSPSRGTRRSRRCRPTGATSSARSSSTRPTTSTGPRSISSPINPRRDGDRLALRFRCARDARLRRLAGDGARCLERCDDERHPRLGRACCACSRDTQPVADAGPGLADRRPDGLTAGPGQLVPDRARLEGRRLRRRRGGHGGRGARRHRARHLRRARRRHRPSSARRATSPAEHVTNIVEGFVQVDLTTPSSTSSSRTRSSAAARRRSDARRRATRLRPRCLAGTRDGRPGR